jgi:hypothetical protein
MTSAIASRGAGDRIPCCIPHCRRTAPREKFADSEEIICGRCWRRIPAARRHRHKQLEKRLAKLWRLYERDRRAGRITASRELDFDRVGSAAAAAFHRSWERMKQSAIEAAGGIG